MYQYWMEPFYIRRYLTEACFSKTFRDTRVLPSKYWTKNRKNYN